MGEHPEMQVPPQGLVSESGIEKAGLDSLHLLQRIFRGGSPDAVEQFIEIEVDKGIGCGGEGPFPHPGAPGEIPAQLGDA